MGKRIGIILVVTNEKHNLKMLYDSLAIQTYKDFTIYFVDNNSSDGSQDYSKKINTNLNLDIRYISLQENSGFAKGNNIGAVEAANDGCKYLFVLNNDTELDKDCLKELLNLAESDEKIGIVGPIFFYWNEEKKNIIQEYGAFINFSKYKIRKNFTGTSFEIVKDKIPESMNVDFVSGGTTFIKTDLYAKIGLWEEKYFIYGDEIDLSKRVKDAGYKITMTQKAKVWHNHNWTKKNKNGYYFEYYLIQRNKYLYFNKFNMRKGKYFSLMKDILLFPKKLFWFIKVCDYKLGVFYLRGIVDGMLNKNGKPFLEFR